MAKPKYRAIRMVPDKDVVEILDRVEATRGLKVELQLLVVGNRASADAADSSLYVLCLDRVDDIPSSEPQPGQPISAHPGSHRIVLRPPQCRVTNSRCALDLVEQIDSDVVG